MKTTLLKKIVKLNPIFSLCLLSNLHAQTLPNTVKAEITQSHSDSLAVCTASLIQLSNKSGDEFNTFLSELDPQCFNKIGLIEKKVLKKIITSEKILSIIDASKLLLENLNEANQKKLTNYAKYLNTSIKINKQHIGLISNFHNLQSQVKSKIHDITYNYAHKLFNKNRTPELKELSHEVFSLINNWETQKESLSLIEYITNPTNHLSMINSENSLYDAIIPIQNSIKIYNYKGDFYKNHEKEFNKIYNYINDILKNLDSQKDEKTYSNYISLFGEYLRYSTKKEEVIETLKYILKNSTKFSDLQRKKPNPIWIETVNVLEAFNISHPGNCIEYIDKNEQNICEAKSKTNDELFQNVHYFEDGQIAIYSSLSSEETLNLYHSMKNVEAAFKTILKNITPSYGFTPKRLQIFIFPTREEYLKYKSFLNDLNHEEDGGIYINSRTSIYMYNHDKYLKDYLLHEFVHFLSYRYLFSENFNNSYISKYSKWLTEGLAVFFAGVNENHFFSPNSLTRDSMIHSNLNMIPNLQEIIDSSVYHSYTHSYGLVSYLFHKNQSLFNQLIKAVKDNELDEYKKILTQFAKNKKENNKYKKHIKKLQKDLINLSNINHYSKNISKKPLKFFDQSEFNDLEKEINDNGLKNTKCELTASMSTHSSIGRFVCKGKFTNKDDVLEAISILKGVNNKFLSTSLTFKDDDYFIEGSIENVKFKSLSIDIQKRIIEDRKNERIVTFRGSNSQTCATFDSTCVHRVYDNSRQIDAEKNYDMSIKEQTKTGEIKHFSRGTIVYENTETASNEKNPVSATLNTQDNKRIFDDQDKNYDVHIKFIKLLNYDERIFTKNIYVNNELNCFLLVRDINSLNRELSREFLNFNIELVSSIMRDYNFEIDNTQLPKNVYAQIFHNNTLCYIDENIKSKEKYPIKINVTKRDLPKEAITIYVNDFDKDPNIVTEKDFEHTNTTAEVSLNLNENGSVQGWINYHLPHILNRKNKYNYQVIKNSKCNNYFRITNYGAFNYDKEATSTCANSDEIIIGVTEITPEKDRSFLKVKLNVNF